MNEIVQRLMTKAGLSEEQSTTAVQTVVGFLKENLPSPIAAQLDNVVNGGGASGTGGIGGALGGMFGNKG